jgi:hypothetical protein
MLPASAAVLQLSMIVLSALDGLFEDRVEVFSQVQTIGEI